MNYSAHSRFDFHRHGDANRRDRDALPRVLLLASASDPKTKRFAGVVVHFAGDEFTREVPAHAISFELIAGLEPGQAFDLGRAVEGGGDDLPKK